MVLNLCAATAAPAAGADKEKRPRAQTQVENMMDGNECMAFNRERACVVWGVV